MVGKSSSAKEGSPSSIQLLRKALNKNSTWQDLDDLLDIVYWARQIIGLILGLMLGLLGLNGMYCIVIYILISTAAIHTFVRRFQSVDVDEVGGLIELAKEGFAPAAATFVVSWIACYTAVTKGW